jgi:hypothetical protein
VRGRGCRVNSQVIKLCGGSLLPPLLLVVIGGCEVVVSGVLGSPLPPPPNPHPTNSRDMYIL